MTINDETGQSRHNSDRERHGGESHTGSHSHTQHKEAGRRNSKIQSQVHTHTRHPSMFCMLCLVCVTGVTFDFVMY